MFVYMQCVCVHGLVEGLLWGLENQDRKDSDKHGKQRKTIPLGHHSFKCYL